MFSNVDGNNVTAYITEILNNAEGNESPENLLKLWTDYLNNWKKTPTVKLIITLRICVV